LGIELVVFFSDSSMILRRVRKPFAYATWRDFAVAGKEHATEEQTKESFDVDSGART
jgi:hypothetical protein